MPSALAVLDTNVVLDLFVWDNPVAEPLRDQLRRGELRCVSDADCLAELTRVLDYPKLQLPAARQTAIQREYAALCTVLAPAAPAGAPLPRCRDRDDQKFLALAVRAHADLLLTRDNALLCMARRMKAHAPRLAIQTPTERLAALRA